MPSMPFFEVLSPMVTLRAVVRRVTTNRVRYMMLHGRVVSRLMRGIYGIHRVTDRTANMDLPIRLQNDGRSAAPAAVALHGLMRQCRT